MATAIAAIELALWDLKAKALGITGLRAVRRPAAAAAAAYRSHSGTSGPEPCPVGARPLRSLDDVRRLGQEVVQRGYRALKTNIVYPGDPAQVHFEGFGGGPGTTDQNVTPEMLRHLQEYLGAFRDAVGPDVGLALDLNFNFKPEAAKRIARALAHLHLMWLEVDLYDERRSSGRSGTPPPLPTLLGARTSSASGATGPSWRPGPWTW